MAWTRTRRGLEGAHIVVPSHKGMLTVLQHGRGIARVYHSNTAIISVHKTEWCEHSSSADLLGCDRLEDQRRLEVIATEAEPRIDMSGTQLISKQCLHLATIDQGYTYGIVYQEL